MADQGRGLVSNHAEQAVILEMQTMRARGWTLEAIVEELNELGVPGQDRTTLAASGRGQDSETVRAGVGDPPSATNDAWPAVVVNEENILTVVAALSNVVRLTRNDDSAHVRHVDNLLLAGRKVNK